MKNAKLIGYALGGAVAGGVGAYVFTGLSMGSESGMFMLRHFLKIAFAGSLMGMAGGVLDWSPRKVLTGALTSAVALIIIILLVLNVGKINIEGSFIIAFVLAISAGFGSLIAIMYSLMDESYEGLTYSAILGAIGGLIGLAVGFFIMQVSAKQFVVFGACYGACVWCAVGLAKRFELIELDEQGEQPADAQNDSTDSNPKLS